MRPQIERVVTEYARLRKEAFRLKRYIDEVPALKNELRSFMDEDEIGCNENYPAGRSKSDLVVATIMDEFSSDNWSPEFCNVMLSFDNWQREIDFFQPDLLFVESAWKGNYSQWSYAFEAPRVHSNAREFDRIISACRMRGIPTLFWNKEDPLHFEKFLDAARLFDLVFTTDAGSVPKYKSALKHDRVFVLPFAAQPALCNPVRKGPSRDARPFFAGSYYVSDHGSRTKQMEMLFDALLDHGGVIYDRSYYSDSPDVRMPEKYMPICVPPVPFDQVVDVYKRHSCAVNVNSVTESKTMMSRRVFEVLACATPVVSTRSEALENLLADVVDIADSPEDVSGLLANYSSDSDAADRRGHRGYRKILREHTYRHRLADVAVALDSSIPGAKFFKSIRPPLEDLKASIILPLSASAKVKETLRAIAEQSYQNTELILVVGPDFTQPERDEIGEAATEIYGESWVISRSLAKACELATGDVLIFLQDCHLYGPEFLYDFILPLTFTEADIIGKSARFVLKDRASNVDLINPEHIHSYVSELKGGPVLLTREACRHLQEIGDIIDLHTTVLARLRSIGLRIYSCDPYNVIERPEKERRSGENGRSELDNKHIDVAFT